ncbi:MAG: penicillin-binding protein 1C, partial [Burkholderiaceae bacterium]|nr:penicillin-binding protein 1C [Burkholderiaceae bacterium]
MKRAFIGAALALAALHAPCALAAMPSFNQVRSAFRPSDLSLVDRDGALVQRVRIDPRVRRGQWVALADISPALRQVMVLSEDKRFYEHSGVDWRAVSAAAWSNLWNTRTRGASTITMQLAGLLEADLHRARGGRSLVQKIEQADAALVLERHWRKDQILEAYLNLIPLRGEIVGIDALSRTLFAKAPQGLDMRDAAIAAVLVRAPNANPAHVAARACAVLRAMHQADGDHVATDCAALDLFTAAVLQRHAFDASDGIAPHFARQALREAQAGHVNLAALPGGVLRTTLSAPLQRFAQEALTRHLRELRGRNVEDGAVVVLDNATGDVLAWVGSSGQLSRASQVDGVLAPRQPGSTLKPLLYAEALAERRLTAASLLNDAPAQISTAGGLYIPQDYDHDFKGRVSVRTALASSLNVPAVRTLVMVTPQAFAQQLRASGIVLPQSGDYYGASLALGSPDVPLLELANAYRMLANGGRFGAVHSLPGSVPPLHQALDARAAFIVGDILSDPNARALTFGLDSVLRTPFWSAVKTGTSKDMRDNWAIGWSQRYTVGVWVGNDGGAPMWDVSGVSGAAPVWADVMGFLHHHTASRAPAPPPGVMREHVRFGDELEAARDEWFIAGTEQSVFALDHAPQMAAPRILAPTDGTIIALDPDIPPTNQRLRLQAQGRAAAWRIDGRPFARSLVAQWLPWPGRHVLPLVAARGKVLDQVHVDV